MFCGVKVTPEEGKFSLQAIVSKNQEVPLQAVKNAIASSNLTISIRMGLLD